jgi:probable rRNA maturation factor
MLINISDQQSALALSVPAIKKIVTQVLSFENRKCDEVSLFFVDVKTICKLHADFFNDPSPTDCISFPMDEDSSLGYQILGEIFISPQAAIDYSGSHNGDPYKELTLYIIHGLLHLMGYDDIEEAEQLQMRQAEERHMNNLIEKKLCLKKPRSTMYRSNK